MWTVYADRVKGILKAQRMQQKELAEKIGVTQSTMCRYLQGNRIPNAKIVAKTAQALNVSSDYLLGLRGKE